MPKFYPPKPALQHATDFFEPRSQQYLPYTEDAAVACNDWIDNNNGTGNESKKCCWQLRCIVDDEEESEDYLDEESKVRVSSILRVCKPFYADTHNRNDSATYHRR